MKPRVFLGSSVEGLSVAYSIQSNLTHDADITIWSQGVFELSKTTIESLFDILNSVDFGVFVFTPDDLTKMRDTTTIVVRDNVLFEFGLFLGKLGRERVFFIIPSDSELHLPTDLLGITPAIYQSNRDDNNWIAATGPASHQVRLMLKKYGSLQQLEQSSNSPELIEDVSIKETTWFDDLMANNFEDAIKKIEVQLETETDKDYIIRLKVAKNICYCKLDEKNVVNFKKMLLEYEDDKDAYLGTAKLLFWEGYNDQALQILEISKEKFGNSVDIINYLTQCHLQNGDENLAIDLFQDNLVETDPELAVGFANIYIENKDFETARSILHKTYLHFPNSKEICNRYAFVASELNLDKLHFISMINYQDWNQEI